MKQVTLRKQLKDPVYRKWFAQPPKETKTASVTPPWFVYVQEKKGGPWRRAEVSSWIQGYRFVVKNINVYHDMSLSHKRQEFRPPIVVDDSGKRKYRLPEAPGHFWCTLCRRMTKFGFFARHHAFPRGGANSGERRCAICGITLRYIKRYG